MLRFAPLSFRHSESPSWGYGKQNFFFKNPENFFLKNHMNFFSMHAEVRRRDEFLPNNTNDNSTLSSSASKDRECKLDIQ